MNNSQFSCRALAIDNVGIHTFDLEKLDAQLASNKLLWLHFAGDVKRTEQWLLQHELISEVAVEAVCTEFTRPRFHTDTDKHIYLTLRTTRQTPQEPLDYMSLRLFAKENLVVSVTLRPNNLIDSFIGALDPDVHYSRNRLFMALCHFIADDFTDFITTLDEDINVLEDSWEDHRHVDLDQLIFVRQKVSRLSRYMGPQLEASQRLAQFIENNEPNQAEKIFHQEYWPVVQNSIRRDVEALNEMRERLMILQETLQQNSSDKINRTMYMLSLVATFFLPLTFVTGLLGMNVAGIPASNNSAGFWIVCGLMVIIAAAQWILFKRWHWLK